MKCIQCSKEINDSAKFCRFCGTPVTSVSKEQPAATEVSCPHCNKKISASAKFCRFCGNPVSNSTSNLNQEVRPSQNKDSGEDTRNIDQIANFVTWHILPGQVAVKIDEKEIAAYKTIKGVYVTPGTKALFFVNGKYAATLESGTYSFKDFVDELPATESKHPVADFFKKIANHIANGVSALFGHRRGATRDETGVKTIFTVILVRGVEFPLIYDLKQVSTANIRSDIGLHVLCKITNLNDFFEGHLVDKKMVTAESFAESLQIYVQTVINQELASVPPQEVENNPALVARVLDALQTKVQNVYPYLTVSQIISLTASREELERIRQLKEELYVAELELEHLQQRNEFLNRLQSVENSNELQMAREHVDFQALMDKINEDHLVNQDRHAQFVELMEAQAELRQATTESDKTVALNKLEQTRLLSEEEIEALKRNIAHRADMDDQSHAHELAMATIQNRIEHDKEALRWEIEIGNQLALNEIERMRMAAQFADERREADFDFEKRQMANKMDLLRQAQALRLEREQDEHNRQMEAQRLQAEADLEHQKIYATMSFEQIMAANPNITPEAAAALAKKFEADAMAAQNDKTAELTRQHSEDLKAILMQQMNLTKDIVSAQEQTKERELAQKQAELDRVHQDSERNQDRFLSGMQTTISSVAGAGKTTVVPAAPIATVFCPNCGKKHAPGGMVCDECGTTL